MSEIDNLKIRRLDGGLLLVFRELLRTRRASQAAQRLGLSQPAISHALSRLRDLFDDPLFVRRPHGFEPTRRALELGPKLEALIALAGEALSLDPGFDPATSRRTFQFGAPEFVTALIGAALVGQLKAVAPSVTFVIGHVAEEEAIRALKTGQGDFAIGRFGAPRPGFTVDPLFADAYCAVARADHPMIQGVLDDHLWRETGHVYAWDLSEVGELTEEPTVRMAAAVPHWLTALLTVASTDAIATVPRRLAERHASMLRLQVLDLPVPPAAISVSVMRRAGVKDPGVDWFLGQVRLAVGT